MDVNDAKENETVRNGFRESNEVFLQKPLNDRAVETAEKMHTTATLTMDTLALRLHASLDEQHISIDIVRGDDVIVLGESVLFGPLYRLARKRLVDKVEGKLPENEHGWMFTVDLADELELNRTVCRLRKLFRRVGVQGAWNVVERRRKKIRIGTGRLLGLEIDRTELRKV
jgi:hypothetical protein